MTEERKDPSQNPDRRRRKPRTRMQMFKETYLPVVIAGVALIFVLVFIIGSISRAVAKGKADREASIASSEAAEAEAQRLQAEAQQLLAKAEALAAGYDYAGAIETLDGFSGNAANYADITAKKEAYVQALSQMEMFDDIAAIPNLSFHLLIADPARAYVDDTYASSYRNNFVTVSEFRLILEQLYANGYMLVDLRDMVSTTTNDDGMTVYTSTPLYLPAGKKPLTITETNTNYYTYMVDGDGDGLADQDGAGFASKLTVDAQGNLVNEYIDADGTVHTGAYDLVPILEEFIAAHPDFSLRGARATIAVSGYDGLFGYRTDEDSQASLPADAYQAEVDGAKAVADALRSKGYEIACYSYRNMSYGDASATELEADLRNWNEEVVPILGQLNTLVYAMNSDIENQSSYSGTKYDLLKAAGFRYYIGYSSSYSPWAVVTDEYVRQQRVYVNGFDMINNPQYYTQWFDTAAVLDAARSEK